MYFSAFEMQRHFEGRSHTLAQISEKARRIAQEVDENLTDALSLMELNFSLDGFGRLCNDLGKTCEVSKLAKIPGKCIDLAKKFADEVSADWLGLDIKPTDIESVMITHENIEVSNDKNGEDHDDLAISGSSNDDSESNSNDASDQESEEKPLPEVCVCHHGSSNVVSGESKYALPEVCGCNRGSSSVVPGDKIDKITAEADNLISLPVIVNSETLLDELASLCLQLTSSQVDSSPIDIDEALRNDFTSYVLSSGVDAAPIEAHVDATPIEAHVDQNALVQASKSHEGSSTLGPSDKTVETAAEADNLVNFSKPIEFGGFEDVDLKDDWEDDTDYDLDLVSYFESNKNPSKKKMAAKFISRLRRSMKSPSVEVAHKPNVKSTDSDWEFL